MSFPIVSKLLKILKLLWLGKMCRKVLSWIWKAWN